MFGTAWLARAGSGVFLVVQMIILLDLMQSWNDSWVEKDDERSASACCLAYEA